MQDIFKSTKNQLNNHLLCRNQPFTTYSKWQMEDCCTYPDLLIVVIIKVFWVVFCLLMVVVMFT